MKIFVAAGYSARVNYDTGEVFSDYKEWLEKVLGMVEHLGHTVFCALREDDYKINNGDPASAFRLDFDNIAKSDALLALVDNEVSGGVQAEIGFALGINNADPTRNMPIFLAHDGRDALDYLNNAMVAAGAAQELILPPIPEGNELPVIPEDWVQKLAA